MKESHRNLLKQFSRIAEDGLLGEEIAASRLEYEKFPSGIPVMLKLVSDFLESSSSTDQELSKMRNLMCQLLIVAYREARRKNPEIAEHFLNSFTQDYPNVPESCLLPKWIGLANACVAFRETLKIKNCLLVWQQTIKQFQAYNEFLNGLLGYLIILWRTHLDKDVNPNVLNANYGSKKKQLGELTGGENGAFYFFLRIAQPEIRNAIAHESIWLDSDTGTVHYNHGNQDKIESKIPFINFMAYAGCGSHIPQTYLAALSVIFVMEFGSDLAKSLLPEAYRNVFTHPVNK
ncbi:hypothetical protein VU07_02825 [Desulfobulbus sp. F4]|nr:hypothetical protein [Desulfobulbus sp. F4]